MAHQCKDFEYCGNMADEKYTMDYTDVEPGAYIYWCSKCGPFWTDIEKVLNVKLEDDKFATKFEKLVSEAHEKARKSVN